MRASVLPSSSAAALSASNTRLRRVPARARRREVEPAFIFEEVEQEVLRPVDAPERVLTEPRPLVPSRWTMKEAGVPEPPASSFSTFARRLAFRARRARTASSSGVTVTGRPAVERRSFGATRNPAANSMSRSVGRFQARRIASSMARLTSARGRSRQVTVDPVVAGRPAVIEKRVAADNRPLVAGNGRDAPAATVVSAHLELRLLAEGRTHNNELRFGHFR